MMMVVVVRGADVVVVKVCGDSQRRAQQQTQPHQTVAIVSLEMVS